LAVIALLGFTSAVPLVLSGQVLQGWLKSAGVGLDLIGLFALVGLPYTLKFLWSPLLDRYLPPFGGRRRGWILLLVAACMLALMALAMCDPARQLWPMALLALLVAFASASADINIDAWRSESLAAAWIGLGTTVHFTLFRVGMVLVGAGALWLSDRLAWRQVYLGMSLTLLPGAIAALLAPEPPAAAAPATLVEAITGPFKDFLGRRRALEALAFILCFKLGDTLATALNVAFLMDVGYSRSEIGLASNLVGLAALVLGGLATAWVMHRWRLLQALWLFGLLQLAGLLATAALAAAAGRGRGLLVVVLALENGVFGMGTVGLLAAVQRLCDPARLATQFAFLTCLMAFARVLLATPAGLLARVLGWPGFFLLCALLALPGLVLLTRFNSWEMPGGKEEKQD
jgi:PAT family beta-lactamase induction signal transducer AmpG